MYALPLKEHGEVCLESVGVHAGEVSKLKVSADGKYVFSGGQDGSIFVHAVQEVLEDGTIIAAGVRQQAAAER